MKILLIDDHAMFREGIALLLKHLDHDICVIQAGTCRQGFEALEQQSNINLILLDLGLPDMPGIDAIGELKNRYPHISVVVLSSAEDRKTVLTALDRGAMGFIPKTYTSEILVGALKLVLAKGIYLPPSVFLTSEEKSEPDRNLSGDQEARKSPADLGLTDRQADVLFLILQGKSTKLICRELDLAEGTVKNHTIAVLRALNVTTRTQAVISASKLGLTFGNVTLRR